MTASQRAGIPSIYPGIPTWIMDNLTESSGQQAAIRQDAHSDSMIRAHLNY